MTDDYTLSLSEIAKLLNKEKVDIADSTVRKYAHLYSEFLPSRKLEGVRWEKYLPDAIDIIRQIFVLSGEGKPRHEIKVALKAAGFGMTLDADTLEVNDTVNEPAQSYNHTPAIEHLPYSNNLAELQAQHSDLIARYHASVMKEAAESLKLYHTLMIEKNVQIKELESLVEHLRREMEEIKQKYQAELHKILNDVVRWQARSFPKQKTAKPKPELV